MILEKFKSMHKKLRAGTHLRLLQEPTSHSELLYLQLVYRYKEIINLILHSHHRKVGEAKIEELRKKRTQNVFVFANGPSVSDLDFLKIKQLVEGREFDLITMNSFASGAIEQYQIFPTAIALCDPIHFSSKGPGSLPPNIEKDIEVINKYRIPVLTRSEHVSRQVFKEMIPVCGVFSPYRKNVSNIQKPLGFYGITSLFALAAAIHIGYKNIYICGFDNSRFKELEVDRSNHKYYLDQHFYEPDKAATKLMLSRERFGLSSHVLMDACRHFQYLEKIQKNKPHDVVIRNIALTTYTDAFERHFDLDVYKNFEMPV